MNERNKQPSLVLMYESDLDIESARLDSSDQIRKC